MWYTQVLDKETMSMPIVTQPTEAKKSQKEKNERLKIMSSTDRNVQFLEVTLMQ